jgi:hypothetical protein
MYAAAALRKRNAGGSAAGQVQEKLLESEKSTAEEEAPPQGLGFTAGSTFMGLEKNAVLAAAGAMLCTAALLGTHIDPGGEVINYAPRPCIFPSLAILYTKIIPCA